ncbi:hypothetical protein [Mycobacterium mantenii]|uniref:hypothetical protein n=1 Tax=Mycobacterium mantenii TaxID=560555 RepID=UPI000A816C57|nr:hypothetical protein [Mycobacterium mantenii]
MSLNPERRDWPLKHIDSSFVEPRIRAWLSHLLDSETGIQELALTSRMHRNGFVKIPVEPDVLGQKTGRTVLHVWPPNGARGNEEPHNHRWDFHSVLLRGAMRISTFRVCDDRPARREHSYSEWTYASPGSGTKYEMNYQRDVLLELERSYELLSGESHFARHEVVHTVSVPSNIWTSSVFLQSNPILGRSLVYMRGPNAVDSVVFGKGLNRDFGRPSLNYLTRALKHLMSRDGA